MSSFNSVVKFASIPTKIAHKPRKNFHSPVNFNNNNRKARIFIINFIYDFPRSPERTKRREKFPLKCSWHSLAKYTVERIFYEGKKIQLCEREELCQSQKYRSMSSATPYWRPSLTWNLLMSYPWIIFHPSLTYGAHTMFCSYASYSQG